MRAPVLAAVLVGIALLGGAAVAVAGSGTISPDPLQDHPDIGRMHERMTAQYPEMGRMHEQLMGGR